MMILDEFPNTRIEPFVLTSHVDVNYNCIAWAAEDTTRWYEPDPDGYYYWPNEVEREYKVEAYINLYKHLGYERCETSDLEEGFLKIAIFANNNMPTHAARQLENGKWTSKLGRNIDVEHSMFSMENGFYGQVIQYMRRLK